MDYVRSSISWERAIFKPHPGNRIFRKFPTSTPVPFVGESLPGTTSANNVGDVLFFFHLRSESLA